MGDSFVVLPKDTMDGAIWFGKNCTRTPGEPQWMEWLAAAEHDAEEVFELSGVQVPQVARTHRLLLSRIVGQWGGDMGCNEHGVMISRETVLTRMPAQEDGLRGEDLVRLALERGASAKEALEHLIRLLTECGQKSECFVHPKMYTLYNAFLVVDKHEAYILDTAGEHWAAKRLRTSLSFSNMMTIHDDYDFLSEGAHIDACQRGWSSSAERLDFSKSFSAPMAASLTGGQIRRSCTTFRLKDYRGRPDWDVCVAALTEHGGFSPADGWSVEMPCAHASWWPTRQKGQTNASMICRLSTEEAPAVWATGTSSPCLSVFKPIPFEEGVFAAGPVPGERYDADSLFWRHERMHRLVLENYIIHKRMYQKEREALQALCRPAGDVLVPEGSYDAWEQHRQLLLDWFPLVETTPRELWLPRPFDLFWKRQKHIDGFPATI
ncbi:MAG: hypothetical protein CL920_14760 [Deltaproteobacteria bacterium]|nr:hypothetical protein [Deltaproteobacteria bacterium]MBU49946.1 hypothetical protein [Deltaproteobacteria bacterium]